MNWNLEPQTLPSLFFFFITTMGKKPGQLVTSDWTFADTSHGFFTGCVFFPFWSEHICVVKFCLWSVCLDCLNLLTPKRA